MAKTTQLPWYLSLGNKVTTSLLRAGFKLVGPGIVVGSYPMYLLTVRGRKSGLPRTTPIAIIERNGRRYVSTPYGVVDWVRNLRAAGEATLTRGRRTESVSAVEQSPGEAALIMREEVRRGNPFARAYGVAADAPLEEYERAALIHPLFRLVQLERVA
jgi:deazaflavin-dependent oxidoreductase (nitroreductase family)